MASPLLPQHQPNYGSDANDSDDDHSDEDTHHGMFSAGFVQSSLRISQDFSQRFSERFQEGFTPLYHTVSEVSQTLAHPTFALSTRARDPEEDRRKNFRSAGTSSVASEVANLSKNTIGGGVMSLSGGIALFANDPSAVIAATGWILGLGILFGYYCLVSGKACDMSLSATYRECWERTVGNRGGIWVAIVTTADPLMGLFANSAILSQSLSFTLRGLGIYLNIPQCLVIIAVVALLPLCLMKNLGALAPFSVFGMAAVFTALGCMIVRYLDGSYLPGGEFYEQIAEEYRPVFGTKSNSFSFAVMPFVCMAFTGFDMHYNRYV